LVHALEIVSTDRDGLQLTSPEGRVMRIGLLGRHQAANAGVALAILEELARAGIASPTEQQVMDGFAHARWPGRMELVSPRGRPDIILDGAHNPAGVEALAQSLADLLPRLTDGPPTVLMGVLANHWQLGMLDPLAEVLPRAALIATRVPGSSGGSLDPTRVAAAWGAGAMPIADTDRAMDAALERSSTSGGPLIVCGSLYLVGYVRARLMAGRAT
jgi:dihydrofolate synthase/folylpolyglutamate synthase